MSTWKFVEVLNRSNEADLPTTLIHEYAHTHPHFDIEDRDVRADQEVDAYVVGRYFGFDTRNSTMYLAA